MSLCKSYIDGKEFLSFGNLYNYHSKKYKISKEETAIKSFYTGIRNLAK